MSYDSGFSRRSSSERDLQPVAITSVDPPSRFAIGATRTRHTIRINCAYATGDTITMPAVGEQWYCERFDMEWRLYGRIPFNDPTLNIEPEAGQVSVGSAMGPLELNGTEIRVNNVLRLGEAYYRDSGTGFERSIDKKTWTAIAGGTAGMVQIISEALAHYTGTDQTLAIAALKSWGSGLDTAAENFNLVWNLLCGNVFVDGLKRLGVGTSDVAMIVDGFQNFINYLFGVVFCNFSGDLTPQTILASLRDLLAPIVSNPFVQGLAGVATALGVAGENLLNSVVAGLTGLIELLWNILTCQWGNLDLAGLQNIVDAFTNGTGAFGPGMIVDFLKTIFLDPVFSDLATGTFTPIIGNFLDGLRQIANLITGALTNTQYASLLEGVVQGVQDFVQIIYDTVTQILSGAELTRLPDIAAIISLITGTSSAFSPANIVRSVTDFFTLLGSETFITNGVDTGVPNPVGILINTLANFWKSVMTLLGEQSTGNVFKDVVKGIAEIIDIFHDLFLVNPFVTASRTAFTAAIAKLEAAVAGAGTTGLLTKILGVIGQIFEALIDNPIAQIIREFLTIFNVNELFDPIINEGNLLTQVFQGFEKLFNLTMKIITEVLIPLGHDNWEELLPFVPASVWTGIWNTALPTFPTANFLTIVSDLLSGAGSVVTDLLTRLLAVFGIDFDPKDANGNPIAFNATTALTAFVNKFLVTGLGGVIGTTVAELTRFFDRLKNFFGLANFFTSGTFDFVAAAKGFVENVLVNAPALAMQTLSSAINIAGTIVYDFFKGLIELLSKVPLIGPPLASAATGLLDNFFFFTRNNVNSGTNLLVDPGAEKAGFWPSTGINSQAGVTRVIAPKRSGGGSLMVSAGNFVWWNVNDVGERSPIRTQPSEYIHSECYVYSYYSSTVYLYARAENSITGAAYDYYLTSGTANSSGWTKVEADIQMPATHPTTGQPSGWDRVSFGLYAVNYPTYVDDMLVREITAAQVVKGKLTNLNQALYQADDTPVGSTPKIKVDVIPTGIPATSVQGAGGVGTIGAQVGDLSGVVGSAAAGTGLAGTVSGPGGLVGTVGSAASGTGLAGEVYGANGQGGILGTGGKIPTINTTLTGNAAGTGTTGLVGTVGSAAGGTGLAGALYNSTNGLLYRLFGGTTNNSIGPNIQKSALPTELKTAVGSGVILYRSDTTLRSALAGRSPILSDYFSYNPKIINSSNDITVYREGVSNTPTALVVSQPGWYMVSLSYGLRTGNTSYANGGTSAYDYSWGLSPLIYLCPASASATDPSVQIRAGSDVVHHWASSATGTFGWAPRRAQASWIVYLPTTEGLNTVRPGYDFTGHLVNGSYTSENLHQAIGDTSDTYFAMSLLNRSLL